MSDLRLEKCKFATEDVIPTVRLGQVERLEFDRTNDVNVALAWVKDSSRLKKLRISRGETTEDCELKEAGMEILVSLPNLEELELVEPCN